jgi:hypothetical protein
MSTEPDTPSSMVDLIYVNQDVTEYIHKVGIRYIKAISKNAEAYAILLHPRLYIHGEGCVIRNKDSEPYEVLRKDGSTESISSLEKPLKDGSRLITVGMMDTIYKYIQRGWAMGNITGIPGDTKFLQSSDETPPNRVIVVIPVIPEQLELNTAVVNTTIHGIRDTFGASLLLVEAEPGEIFRDDTRTLTSIQMGIEIAREEFAKIKEAPGIVRTIVIPTSSTLLGMFTPELMRKMLYDAVINRERNSGWTLITGGEASKDIVRIAGYTGKLRKATINATGETMEIAGVRVLTTRIRILGGDAYPTSTYALFPNVKSGMLRLGDSVDAKIHESFMRFKKIQSGIPYKVDCYSEYYRTAILSCAYRAIRKASKENIKRAIALFTELVRYGTDDVEQICGTPITENDIPTYVTSKGLVSATEGRTGFAKNIGYVVTMTGKDSWVVVGEDKVNGVSIVLPDPEHNMSLTRDYQIVPTSYLYRYTKAPLRKAILPGKGANEYLCVWEHEKPLGDTSPIPIILERCFFGDAYGLPGWNSVDGKWLLRFKRTAGYNGWVLIHKSSSGDTEFKNDSGTPLGNMTGSWCGTYGAYMISAKISNPLVAIGGMVIQDMMSNSAYTQASKEVEKGELRAETIDSMMSHILHENRIDTPIRITNRAHIKAVTELNKTGLVSKSKGETIYQKYASSENTLASLRSFTKATIPNLEMAFCHRMMMFAMYPHTGIHKAIRDDSGNYSGLLKYFRWMYKTHGFPSLCIPSVCSMVATYVFRPVRPRANEEVRLAVDAPIMTYPTSASQKNRANGYLQTPTNPEFGDMNQFVTFAANESQLMSMVVMPWHYGGVPSWKPIIPREPGNVMMKKIYRAMRERADLPMYQDIGPMDVLRGIQYGFHRLRVSLFVSIRKGAMVVFAPMVKADYSNYLPRSDEFWFGPMTQSDYLNAKNRFLKAIGKRPERYEPRSRWFVNNSLVGNMISKSLTSDQTIPIVLEMLRETILHEKVNDCDFMINTRDYPKLRRDGRDPDHAAHGLPVEKSVDMPGFEHKKHLPILGFNVHSLYADIPIPVPDDWKNVYGGYYGKDERGSLKPTVPHPVPITEEQWALRQPKAAFRGGATGIASTTPLNQRLMLAEMVEALRKKKAEEKRVAVEDVILDDFDVEIVSAAIRDKKVSSDGMKYMIPSGSSSGTVNTEAVIREDKRMGLRTQLVVSDGKSRVYRAPDAYTAQDRNQMVIYVDGNAAAYRYSGLMAAGFVILRVASRIGYEMWFYPALTNALPGSDDVELDLDDSRFNPEGDHILVDPDMKNLQRIIHWVRDHPKKAIKIAENSIKKYTKLFRKSVLRQTMATAINLASVGQTWSRSIPEDKITNVRIIQEPREAKSYRNALRVAEKRQAERERVAADVEMMSSQDVVSDSVGHTNMTTQDAPTEGYERDVAPGIVVVPKEEFEKGREVVEDVESMDVLPTFPHIKKEIPLRRPSGVLSKYTHGALRRQVLRFSAEDDGDDVHGYVTDDDIEA